MAKTLANGKMKMPNWVYNTLVIDAKDKEEYDLIRNTLAAPIVSQNMEGEVYNESVEFSFQNIIFVSPDKYKEYFTTHGWGPEGATGQTEYNWYNWNNNVWGCKWDAGDVDTNHQPESNTLVYTFSTPWSPPIPVMYHLKGKFPDVNFSLEYEEEQGWGGEWVVTNGNIYTSEYDIPNSHEDYQNPSRSNNECPCTYEADAMYWYKDCPVDTEKYVWVDGEWSPASDTPAADAVSIEKESV